jgi:hypothetical protein
MLKKDENASIDKDYQMQRAMTRYRCIKSLKPSELTLDEQIFLENFELLFVSNQRSVATDNRPLTTSKNRSVDYAD